MNQTTVEVMEFEDKTVDKAIEAACSHFNCDKDQLEVEIITRGSTGLFGLGGKKAKIKAWLKEEFQKEALKEQEGPQKVEETEAQGDISSEKDDDKGREKDSEEPEVQAAGERPGRRQEVRREELEKHVAVACRITNEILEKAGLSGKAHVVEQTSKPFINITGDDLSLIIGKEGQTLDALEYLVNLCLRRESPDIHYRVMLEAAGYRERRKKGLVSLAERLAIKVKRSGRSLSLQPMPARERRIIHVALKEFKGVRTHSSGQGASRKVVITPVKKRRHQGRSRN